MTGWLMLSLAASCALTPSPLNPKKRKQMMDRESSSVAKEVSLAMVDARP